MIYVFDSCSFIDLFREYDKESNVIQNFNRLILENKIISVREVYKEIFKSNDDVAFWAKKNKHIFEIPELEEFFYVSEIFQVNHFKMMIRRQQILLGTPVADPFLIAKTRFLDACLITNEKYAKNGAKIPNVCNHFNVKYLNLDEFITKENLTEKCFIYSCPECHSNEIKYDSNIINQFVCNDCNYVGMTS